MNTVLKVLAGMALLAILAFQQLEISTLHDDIQDIKIYLIKTQQRVQHTQAEADCLARNIFYEAGVEDRLGKFAVAQVTLNRLKEKRWGTDICKVVYARAQFSWTLDKKKRYAQPKGPLWAESKEVAHKVLQEGYRVAGLEQSTYYHADYIKEPIWSRSVVKIQQIGQHIFYKKPYPV